MTEQSGRGCQMTWIGSEGGGREERDRQGLSQWGLMVLGTEKWQETNKRRLGWYQARRHIEQQAPGSIRNANAKKGELLGPYSGKGTSERVFAIKEMKKKEIPKQPKYILENFRKAGSWLNKTRQRAAKQTYIWRENKLKHTRGGGTVQGPKTWGGIKDPVGNGPRQRWASGEEHVKG